MSGGFFRGTSADQDTRFSNKQAKLLKSQKFPPELEQLVDMRKVKMDVIRPWIANRVTELLGFEDEVLINFIYGLLDGKEVDGKQIQIQLTGFMEKNTGRFMKELWVLLLSAQKNVSGVPQQFLDAKEEETRKKKEEADRITHEIQKKKEKERREFELEKQKKMDDEADMLRAKNAVSDANSKHPLPRASSVHPDEEEEADKRHVSRGKTGISKSPHSPNHSPTNRRTPSATRSSSKSFSNSRSYSDDRHKSRSISGSPQPRRRSLSIERRFRSPRKRSVSPPRKYSPRNPRSPLRRRSPHSRRSSISRSRRRSPSPIRHRSPSPMRRRSPPPMRRRSPSPMRRRSPAPIRRRSPIPVRRRSPSPPSPPRRTSPIPVRRRSPNPVRRRSPSPPSPSRRRSPTPVRRRSPIPVRRRSPSPSRRRSPSPRWRSPSLLRRRSPSPLRRRSPLPTSPRHHRRSPVRSARRRVVDSQISPRQRNRSRSPYRGRSPPYRSRRSSSREHNSHANGVESRRNHDDLASQRTRGKRSPLHHSLEKEEVARKRPDSVPLQPPITLRSPQRVPRDRGDGRHKVPLLSPPGKYPSASESPPLMQKMNPIEDSIHSESPARQTRQRSIRHDTPERSRVEREITHARDDVDRRADSSRKRNRHSPILESRNKPTSKGSDHEEGQRPAADWSSEGPVNPNYVELRKKDRAQKSDNASPRTDYTERRTQQSSRILEEIEYGPGRLEGESFSRDRVHVEKLSARRRARDSFSPDERLSNEQTVPKRDPSSEYCRVDEKQHSLSRNDYSDPDPKTEAVRKSIKKVDRNNHVGTDDSDSDKNGSLKVQHMEKRKYKRPEIHLDDDAEYDSQRDERKEAKRRRKEEKKLRKEERRRRREERHHKKEERRAGKLKNKCVDTVTPPSDFEKNQNDGVDSDGDVDVKRGSHPSDSDDPESEQKKLEIELRKKALESLRAKKAISH
ncbi:splicing factor PWI domain-containing protein isoform X2 [Tasmannia lanceolata]|uniref:splicing factor PWI domain-containing protein isoform X2 n=1 Tax=Tasmannia lanceolata TaxID=3420 RepID=UPI004062CDD3